MMDDKILRRKVEETVMMHEKEIWEISRYLFENPETGLQEYMAVEKQCAFLQQYGYTIQRKAAGLDTAFIAGFQRNSGPCIALFSEYDGLPGGLGHACGHNLIAAATMGAALAVKEAMEAFDVSGTIMIVGAPDEEYTGGKIKLLEAGCLKHVDAAMAVHPTSAVSRIAGGCNAYQTYLCEYTGKTAHSGNRPWDGINAQDAVLLFFNALGYARQALKDGVRVNAWVKNGMQHEGTISAYACVGCDISAPNVFMVEEAAQRIEKCFQCGAVGTGCKIQLNKSDSSKNRIPNSVIGELFRQNCICYGEAVMEGMPDDNGGEDLGDVSHVIPAVNPHLTVFSDHKISLHTEEFRNQVMTPEGKHMCLLGARAMAATAIQLMQSDTAVRKAREELTGRLKELYGKDVKKYINT